MCKLLRANCIRILRSTVLIVCALSSCMETTAAMPFVSLSVIALAAAVGLAVFSRKDFK